MKSKEMELGDTVVVIRKKSPHYAMITRNPKIKLEGHVTAVGESCIRIKWKSRIFGRWREKWFSLSALTFDIEKTSCV